jgi:nucleoside-diphosphate-sugar epimerase
MKILIAGGTGALGRPLTAALVDRGHDVSVLARSTRPDDRTTGATTLVADALDRSSLLAATAGRQFDVVVHELTALRRTPARHSGMTQTDALRSTGSLNLLEVARRSGAARFVTQSFIAGYGYVDHGDRTLTEADPFGRPEGDAMDPHLAAMRAAEEVALHSPGIDGIALRYGGLYGPNATLPDLVASLRRRMLPVPRDGGGWFSWIYVDDAVSATAAAIERGQPGRAYNVVDDEPARWGEVIHLVAESFRTPRPMVLPGWLIRMFAPYAGTLMTRASIRASNALAKQELDWLPAVRSVAVGVPRAATAAPAAGEGARKAVRRT